MMPSGAQKLSRWDTLRLQLHLTLPAYLLGIVAPNRVPLWIAVRAGAGRRTLDFLAALHRKYGSETLWTWFPFRRTLVVLAPATIEQVLRSDATAPDPALKKHAVSRFAPGALVISNRDEARGRRPFNTATLDLGRLHRHAGTFAAIAHAEVRRLAGERSGTLRWKQFQQLGERVSHQVILGRGCLRPELAKDLARLVRWSNVPVRHAASFAAFHGALDRTSTGEEPPPSHDCLMHEAISNGAHDSASLRRSSQAAFWFFVLKDAIELHGARTLALLAAHPDIQARARAEIGASDATTAAGIDGLRYLEACVEEQLRLWTPVPVLLRRAEERFELEGTFVDAEDQVLIHAGFHHRNRRVFGDLAETFWPDPAFVASSARYAFSAHGRSCAGRSLVTFLLKAVLASLLLHHRFELDRPVIQPGRIPPLYDHFAIELRAMAAG